MESFTCTFEIPGPATAKQSFKYAVDKESGKVRKYTDSKVANYEGLVTMCATPHAPPAPLDGAVWVEILALFPRPSKFTDRYKDGRLKNGAVEGRMPYPQKPDREQIEKAINDGLQRAGFGDDKQFTDGPTTKRYVAIGEQARSIVTVRWPVEV